MLSSGKSHRRDEYAAAGTRTVTPLYPDGVHFGLIFAARTFLLDEMKAREGIWEVSIDILKLYTFDLDYKQ